MGRKNNAKHVHNSTFKIHNVASVQRCKVCNIVVDLYQFQSHLNSESHKRKVLCNVQSQVQADADRRGIRIEEPPIQLDWGTIVNYFRHFGKILAIIKLDCACVLVQFEHELSVSIVLQSFRHTIPAPVPLIDGQPPVLQNLTISVYPRRLNDGHLGPQGHVPFHRPSPIEFEQKLKLHFQSTPRISNPSNHLWVLVSKFQTNDNLKLLKNKIMWDVSSYLYLEYPQHVLYMFGSTVMGLDLSDSDVDIYFCYAPDVCQKASKQTKIRHLTRAGQILMTHPDVRELTVIPHARVPVIKFVHSPTGIMCDMISDNKLGVMRSQFIAAIRKLDDRINTYFLALKIWAKARLILGSPLVALSSYSLTLLALFYLQRTTPSVIPPVATLQSQVPAEKRLFCQGWNVSYNLQRVNKNQTDAVGNTSHVSVFSLVKGFFEFYQSFDPKEVVVCPLVGDTVPRENFNSDPPSLDSDIFKPYLNSLKSGIQPIRLTELTVQDPFELNNNVTALYKNYEMFQSLCKESFEICSEIEKPEVTSPISIERLFFPTPRVTT